VEGTDIYRVNNHGGDEVEMPLLYLQLSSPNLSRSVADCSISHTLSRFSLRPAYSPPIPNSFSLPTLAISPYNSTLPALPSIPHSTLSRTAHLALSNR